MTQKRPLQILAAGLLVLSLTLTPVGAYNDVNDNDWYAKAVTFCQQHELVDGVTSSNFQPDAPMTRADLTEALYRLEGSPAPVLEEGAPLPFSDVAADHPNLNAILWAEETGVVTGYPDGTFAPDDPILREQVAALLWRANGEQPAAAASNYIDAAEISSWAMSAVEWAYGARLMRGTSTHYFMPQSNITRAEGATLIRNYARRFYGLEDGYPLPESQPVAPNSYDSALFSVDENGYLSYAGDGPAYRGLDVSAHQKAIDWTKVANAGMDFAIIRAGYRGYTAGRIVKDDYFEANIQGALANGLDVGVYFFSQAITPAEAEEEAYQLLEWIEGYNITYPVVFDWEEQDYDISRTQGIDGNTVTACARAFCKVVEDAGYIPMTYGSPSKIYSGGIMLDRLQDYPAFWLAHYTRNLVPTSFRYHYNIWQYSSSGRVDGISGNVDLDLCLTDWSDWKQEEPIPEIDPSEENGPENLA